MVRHAGWPDDAVAAAQEYAGYGSLSFVAREQVLYGVKLLRGGASGDRQRRAEPPGGAPAV